MQFAADADKHLVQEPFVTGLWPAPLEALREGPSEAEAPFPDGLVADHDAPRCQEQLDFAQAQAEAVIQPDVLVDDFSRKAAAAVRVGRCAHARDPAIRPNLRQLNNTPACPSK